MTSMDLLEIMAAVKDKYILEAHSNTIPYRRRISFKRNFLIAAIIAMMLLLVGCAVVFMKLRELKIGQDTYTYPYIDRNSESQFITSDIISMQGFMGSVNYQAAKEWNEFVENYDTDEKLLENADTDDYQESMEYMSYLCYTQEMQDKIDEICDKYDLELLGPVYTEEYAVDIVSAVGIENIFADTANVPTVLYDGYYYQDGTFALSGNTVLNYKDSPWIYPINYQYRCVMKTAFDGVCLSVGDMDSYEEWNYKLKDGTEVLLALSTEKALMIVDKQEYFVTVNILETRVGDVIYGEQQMSKEGLEAFAETFTFDYVPVRPDPNVLETPEWFTTEESTQESADNLEQESIDKTSLNDSIYIGEYLDTDVKATNLEIAKREDGKYTVQIEIYRLTFLSDGVGELIEEGMCFTATDAAGNPISGMITVEGQIATVTFTDSTWNLLENGTSFQYSKIDADTSNLLDKFLTGEIDADGNGLYVNDSFNISELQMDEEAWDSYSVGDRLDLDNDGIDELILSGPYGGMYLDASDDKVKVFASGDGTASNLSYIYCDNEIWIVHSDIMHGGRKYYNLEKYSGADNVVESVTLEMHYQAEDEAEPKTYYLNGNEISEMEYDELYQKFFGNIIEN